MLGPGRSTAAFVGGASRILAIRAGALGDTVLALPAIGALARLANGGGEKGGVDFLGTAPFTELARLPGPAEVVHSIDRRLFGALFHEEVEEGELLEFLARFDLVVSWSRLPLLRRKLAGLGTPCLEAPPHPPEGVHASEHLFRVLEPLGIRGPAPPPAVVVGEVERAEARAFLDSKGLRPGEFVAIHPSSGSAAKNWPLERFRGLAERIRSDGRALLWVEGEADGSVLEALLREAEASPAAPVARGLPLRVLAAVLADAGLFIGNDSGVTHLAAASGAPSMALFGPTDPERWAPRGPWVTVVDFGTSVETLWGKAREMFRV